MEKYIATILWIFLLAIGAKSKNSCQLTFGGSEFKDRMCSYRKNAKEFDAFYGRLLIALDSNDHKQISKMMKYPIFVIIDGKRTVIRNPEAFIINAKQIFNQNFRKLIFNDVQNLTHLSSGIMLGKGELWFNTRINHGKEIWKITAINNDI